MHKRTDDNQEEIVHALLKIGCTVQLLSDVGGGCPDILVGYHGKNYLLEIKDENKPPSQRKLTPAQDVFHGKWRGQKAVVKNIDEAFDVVMER